MCEAVCATRATLGVHDRDQILLAFFAILWREILLLAMLPVSACASSFYKQKRTHRRPLREYPLWNCRISLLLFDFIPGPEQLTGYSCATLCDIFGAVDVDKGSKNER